METQTLNGNPNVEWKPGVKLKTSNVLTLQLSACPVSGGSSGTSYSHHQLSRTRMDQSASKQATCQRNSLTSPPWPHRQKKGDETREHGRVSDHLASNGCQTSHIAPKFLHGHNNPTDCRNRRRGVRVHGRYRHHNFNNSARH